MDRTDSHRRQFTLDNRKGNDMRHFRQGDVFVQQVGGVPKDAAAKKREGDVILAYGEVTGHAHRVKEAEVREFTAGDRRFLEVLGISATITHEEHAPIELPCGVYEIIQQREYSPEAIRNVAD